MIFLNILLGINYLRWWPNGHDLTLTHKIKKLILWTSVIHFFLGWSWEFGVLSGPEFLTLLLLILFWISFFVTFIISI